MPATSTVRVRHSYCNLNQTAFEEAWCHYAAQVEAEFEGFAVCFATWLRSRRVGSQERSARAFKTVTVARGVSE